MRCWGVVISLLFILASIQLVSSDVGPILYFSFDEGSGDIAVDSSGNGYNGTIYGATWALGENGSALSFDGINDNVQVIDRIDPDDYNNGLSFGGWAYLETNTTEQELFGWFQSGSWGRTYIDCKQEGNFSVRFGCGSSIGMLTSSTHCPAQEWFYVAATHNTTENRLYLNGQLIENWTSETLTNNQNDFCIGATCQDSLYSQGLIDEVKIYNYTRNETQILEDYTSHTPITTSTSTTTTSTTSTSTTSTSTTSTTTSSIPSEVPLLYCKFDGTTVCEGNETAIIASGNSYEEGYLGQGTLINDSDNLSYPSLGNFNKDTGTIEMWFQPKWDSASAGEYIFFWYGIDFDGILLDWGDHDQERFLYSLVGDNSPSIHNVFAYIPFNASQWHHLAVTWGMNQTGQNDTEAIYFDGELINYTPTNQGVNIFIDQYDQIDIGNKPGDLKKANSVIDELKIFDHPRNQTQIQEDMKVEETHTLLGGWSLIALTLTP
ncbi:MAG: LamG domain-containing protein [Candidatus Altiarchaeota archaeon]